MRRAVNLPPFTEASTLIDLTITAEQVGWDAVFVRDHVQWIADLGLDPFDLGNGGSATPADLAA
ncbi:MAG TPA: hypothetical protein VMW08_09180 [Acidimicrobiales bacterium]|nr:hypothetical protein [Acidimicrobiales bacterium]